LGPGAPALVRIRAFLHALVDRTVDQLDLLVMAETASPFARFGAAYDLHHKHLALLIAQAGPGRDAYCLADALLAPLAAPLLAHRIHNGTVTAERVKTGLDDLLSAFGALPDASS
jgi:hypothetical protein